MKEELIYPILLDVKIKKGSLKRAILILEKDKIKFLDKECTKDVIFQSTVVDCETFLRKSTDNTKQELCIISLSKYEIFI
jgi:hypothetical protein